jgi:hypothetical protein
MFGGGGGGGGGGGEACMSVQISVLVGSNCVGLSSRRDCCLQCCRYTKVVHAKKTQTPSSTTFQCTNAVNAPPPHTHTPARSCTTAGPDNVQQQNTPPFPHTQTAPPPPPLLHSLLVHSCSLYTPAPTPPQTAPPQENSPLRAPGMWAQSPCTRQACCTAQ